MESSPPPAADPGSGWERLVPSGITFLFVVGLIVAARFYHLFPLKPAPCGMRTLTGIPCLGCGGTRAMQALARGDVVGALSLNPLVILGVVAVALWFGIRLWRTISGAAPRDREKISPRWTVILFVLLGAANWIYLVLYLPD